MPLIIQFSHVSMAKSYKTGKIINCLIYMKINYVKYMKIPPKNWLFFFAFSCETTGSRHAGSTTWPLCIQICVARDRVNNELQCTITAPYSLWFPEQWFWEDICFCSTKSPVTYHAATTRWFCFAGKITGFSYHVVVAFGSSVLQVVVTLQAIAMQLTLADISQPCPTVTCDIFR